MTTHRKIIITTNFYTSLKIIFDYIKQESDNNAEKFKADIIAIIPKISAHPEANSIVKQLPTKRNWYRYRLYKKRYKVIFKVLKDKVVFLGIVHTSQHPDKITELRTGNYS